jgi:predicted phage-related endonuclease
MITKTDIATMGEAEWLALRHPHIGSSEAATLLGEGYAGSTYWQVYHEKSRPFQPPESDAVIADRLWWGRQMQNVIGQAIVRQFGWSVEEGKHHAADEDRRIAATVDFTAVRPDINGIGIIETKNRDWLFWRDHYDEGQAWVYDEIQLAHQMLLHPGATWGCIGVCVGGNDLRVYDYRREELTKHMDAIEDAVAKFWARVDAGDEPPITYTDLPIWIADRAALDDAEEPAPLPDAVEGLGEAMGTDDLIALYEDHNARAKMSEKVAKDAKAALVQIIGDHRRSRTNAFEVIQTRRNSKERVCTPDMVGQVLRKASTSVTLTVRRLDATAGMTPEQAKDAEEAWRRFQSPEGWRDA